MNGKIETLSDEQTESSSTLRCRIFNWAMCPFHSLYILAGQPHLFVDFRNRPRPWTWTVPTEVSDWNSGTYRKLFFLTNLWCFRFLENFQHGSNIPSTVAGQVNGSSAASDFTPSAHSCPVSLLAWVWSQSEPTVLLMFMLGYNIQRHLRVWHCFL